MLLKTGSDYSGAGAFDQALKRLGIQQDKLFACDIDKYARKTYIENYGEPVYFPHDVYDREIPQQSLDIYMTSPPCQAFSIAGKRKGEDDNRGILFYNSHEFIKVNKPRYFIFENVKGLLSDAKGRTFQIWLDMLGGKSVNGNPVIFPNNDAVPYHIYWKVLNAKDYDIPQNRERVFIVGIRDDIDNDFRWPVPVTLSRKLKHLLQPSVPEKYYLSEKAMQYLLKGASGKYSDRLTYLNKNDADTSKCITANFKRGVPYNMLETCIPVLTPARAEKRQNGRRFKNDGDPMFTITTQDQHGIMIAGTLSGGKWDKTHEQSRRVYDPDGISPTVHTQSGGNQHTKIIDATNLQGNEVNRTIRSSGHGTHTDKHNFDTVVIQINDSKESNGAQPYKQNRIYSDKGISPALDTECGRPKYVTHYAIRRLTPRECFKLMDFPDDFKITVSDTQAYKQAGNSIAVGVLTAIIKNLVTP